jgi:hypothetical protein
VLQPPLPLQDQVLAGHLDLHVLLLHARQLGTDDELVVLLEQLDRRRPLRGTRLRFDERERMAELEVLEDPVHLVREPTHESVRHGKGPR